MATEGLFPKSGGDIAYASEANRFASSQRLLFIGSTGLVISGTGAQEAGSVVIAAGTLPNPCSLSGQLTGSFNDIANCRLLISGASNNVQVTWHQNTTRQYGEWSVILGSPLLSTLAFKEMTLGTTVQSTAIAYSTATAENIDPSEELVIIFGIDDMNANPGSATYNSISIFGGGVIS